MIICGPEMLYKGLDVKSIFKYVLVYKVDIEEEWINWYFILLIYQGEVVVSATF